MTRFIVYNRNTNCRVSLRTHHDFDGAVAEVDDIEYAAVEQHKEDSLPDLEIREVSLTGNIINVLEPI